MGQVGMTNNVPEPILEQGDFVRLKEPYSPMAESFNRGLKQTLKTLCMERFRDHPDLLDEHTINYIDSLDEGELPRIQYLSERDGFDDLFQFTHGTVAEIVSRYPARTQQIPGGQIVQFSDGDVGPPRNVSLHLYNPETGLMYVGGHPTETGKPEFVDDHVSNIVLIHKYNETWGNEYELNLAEVYQKWGIEEPAGFDPWQDDE